VLSDRQQRFIDELCVERHFISLPSSMEEAPVIGTLERVPLKQVEESVPKRPPASVKDGTLVADLQQRR
jgi:hypothetical protein